jgi:hypothetical protein
MVNMSCSIFISKAEETDQLKGKAYIRSRLEHVRGLSIQLGLKHAEDAFFLADNNFSEILDECGVRCTSLHGPLGMDPADSGRTMEDISFVREWMAGQPRGQCVPLVLHPRRKAPDFAQLLDVLAHLKSLSWLPCLENFPSHSKRSVRTPFDIALLCQKADAFDCTLRMCFDTSHIDMTDTWERQQFWLRDEAMKALLPWIGVFHLSTYWTREGSFPSEEIWIPHMPLWGKGFRIDLDPLISILKYGLPRLGWSGIVTLEYMPEHEEKYREHLNELRKRWKI